MRASAGELADRTWVYTQALSDGRIFVQAMHISGYHGIRVALNNPSTEAYTADRAWWIKESIAEGKAHMEEWFTDEDGFDIEEASADEMFANVAGVLSFQSHEPPEMPPIPEL
jgi:hypothetical protein